MLEDLRKIDTIEIGLGASACSAIAIAPELKSCRIPDRVSVLRFVCRLCISELLFLGFFQLAESSQSAKR